MCLNVGLIFKPHILLKINSEINSEKTMTRIHDKLSECVFSITTEPTDQLRGQALNRLCDQLYVGIGNQTRTAIESTLDKPC